MGLGEVLQAGFNIDIENAAAFQEEDRRPMGPCGHVVLAMERHYRHLVCRLEGGTIEKEYSLKLLAVRVLLLGGVLCAPR